MKTLVTVPIDLEVYGVSPLSGYPQFKHARKAKFVHEKQLKLPQLERTLQLPENLDFELGKGMRGSKLNLTRKKMSFID